MAALVAPDEMIVGETLALTGSALASAHAYTITFTGCGLSGVVLKGTTSTTNMDIVNDAVIKPTEPGVLGLEFDDGTNVLTATIQVFQSE